MLILFAHGSSDPKWKKPFEDLLQKLESKLGKEKVCLAYLEKAKPSLMEVIKKAIDEEINQIKILPLFLSSGGHVDRDIPIQVNEIKKLFPEIKIEILEPIGENTEVIDAIYSAAIQSC